MIKENYSKKELKTMYENYLEDLFDYNEDMIIEYYNNKDMREDFLKTLDNE